MYTTKQNKTRQKTAAKNKSLEKTLSIENRSTILLLLSVSFRTEFRI